MATVYSEHRDRWATAQREHQDRFHRQQLRRWLTVAALNLGILALCGSGLFGHRSTLMGLCFGLGLVGAVLGMVVESHRWLGVLGARRITDSPGRRLS